MTAATTEPVTWLNRKERGTVLAIRVVTLCATFLGRRATRGLVRVIALYYALSDRAARRASEAWLEAVHGVPPRFRDVYRHISCFAQVALDRLFLARGATRGLSFQRNGSEQLAALAEARQGAILLGAHLGSFEAMRAVGGAEQLPVHIVGHFANAKMINAVLEELNPELAGRVVHVGNDPVALGLTLRQKVSEGGMLAILADRVGLNDKTVVVPFFGRPAAFPTGPFLLAAALKCPVKLVFGLYYAPNRYELHCEHFADRIVLPRGSRQEALRSIVTAYAARVEDYGRRAPDNWFNFYDFWEADGDER